MSQTTPALTPQVQFRPGVPEEEFWDKYNRRMEFPLSTVAAVLLHAVVGAGLVYLLVALMGRSEDRSSPAQQLVAVTGLDDRGDGSPGSGGQQSAELARTPDPFQGNTDLTPPDKLPDPKEVATPTPLKDPGQKPPLPPPMPAPGGPKGSGDQPGKGTSGKEGTGPDGAGADSTKARGLRWVLRFRIASGRDYVDQLKAMGAEVLVPLDDKKFLLIRDLGKPGEQKPATEADLKRLTSKVRFSDTRRKQVAEVLTALDVKADPAPSTFWAYFPKEVEEELARKELSYRNRRSEDIEETVFRVTMRGGKYEIVVEDQIRKK